MKITFPVSSTTYAEYCVVCLSPNMLSRTKTKDGQAYSCAHCGAVNTRALIIDPELQFEISQDSGEYSHESVGAFIFDKQNRLLMFKLNKFPFGWTIPAGHVARNESAKQAIIREITEETGLVINNPVRIASLTIDGDACRRGADVHKWTVFGAQTDKSHDIVIDPNEGGDYQWTPLHTVARRQNCFAVDYILKQHDHDIQSFISHIDTSK